GSKQTIKLEKFGELTKNIGNYMSKHNRQLKGILIGNPFCEEPLDNRPSSNSQKQLFSKELIESAENQRMTVILSTDLYALVSQILENTITDEQKSSIRKSIMQGAGLVHLS
ncbi:unnamed protein product, partial [marine sediment metagenome]